MQGVKKFDWNIWGKSFAVKYLGEKTFAVKYLGEKTFALKYLGEKNFSEISEGNPLKWNKK